MGTLDKKLVGILKPPRGCRVVRVTSEFTDLPIRTASSARMGGMTFVLAVSFQADALDSYTVAAVEEGSHAVLVPRWNFVSWNPETKKGRSSRRGLCKGKTSRTTFDLT